MSTFRIIVREIRKLRRTVPLGVSLFGTREGISCTLVSASDSSHFKSLCNLLKSVVHHYPSAQVVVYDMGLTDDERFTLQAKYDWITLKIFDYHRYPSYFDITINAGQYGWKAVIFEEEMKLSMGVVIWMDAGNVITPTFYRAVTYLNKFGLLITLSAGEIRSLTHPSMLQHTNCSTRNARKPMLNAACLGVNSTNPQAIALVSRWSDLSKIEECIAPQGSNKMNHRQDQSLLSILVHQEKLSYCKRNLLVDFGVLTHQDVD